MQPIHIAILSFTVCFIVVLLKVGFGIFSDTLQNRKTNQRRLSEEHAANQELFGRLKQTYIDLSLSRRQAKWREVMVVKVVKESENVRSLYLVDQNYEP
ncbi:MAG TPA: hypothetical protein VM260_08585, partial [Pirellula sp.]|nr:hypothetical protein [Pirellula sp.]